MLKALVILLCLSCSLTLVRAQHEVKVVKYDALETLITRDSPKLEVINFWATWCKPCIKELPYFQALHQKMGGTVTVTLISLDFADELNTKVIPFVNKRQLAPTVLLLDEIDYNSWIDKVDSTWTGAIPATLVINHQTGKRKFVENELTNKELIELVNELLN